LCGIAGKVSPRRAVSRDLVEQMCSVIEHRGPDSRGTYIDDGVGLGVQRLRIIDLATGDQPIANEDASVVVVLNGEIYNYRELREELAGRGHVLSTRTDTEVIVHLYEELGDRCVERLRGMFAFALYDRKRRRLLLARDRVGKKPLFYAHRDGELWFGSETRAILQDPEIDRGVDFAAVDSFLHFQYVPHPLTAFAALRKLPPAHTLVWTDGEIELRRYWKLSYAPGSVATKEDAHELIRRELLEATRLRLRSDVPLGAFLSGGVDSSAVVAAMAQQSEGRVKTFSIGFDVARYDETKYAREVAQLYDTDHHELRVEPHAIEVLPDLVWHYGEPFADSSAIPSWYLARMTREHVTVALNGDGGDESFAGYTRYVGNHLSARLGALPLPLRRALRAAVATVGPDRREDSFRSRVDRLTRAALMSPYDRYAMWIAYFNDADRAALYTPEFRAVVADTAAPAAFIRDAWSSSDARDEVNRLLDIDVETYLPGDLLVKMDIASMAHSLEVRSPLLDHVFMEQIAGLPGRWKLQGRTTKKLFKDALRPWIPSHVLDRPKWGFGVPISDWLRGELRELPRDVLLDATSVRRGFFRRERVSALIDEHVAGSRDHGYKLWTLIQLELWLRTFVDTAAPAPVALSLQPA